MNYAHKLTKKITNKTAVVGVIGIGYVGGALALGTSNAGFKTIGFTRTEERVKKVNQKKIKNYKATTDYTRLSQCDIIVICVPTPVHEDKKPDLEPLLDSLELTKKYMGKGTLIIVESTIAPGTTRNVALPILSKTKLKPDEEFFLGFSPERVDPGNKKYAIYNTPRVVSGLSEISLDLIQKFYKTFVKQLIPVSSIEAAEMSKILENTFRFVNISLMNEMLSYTRSLGIDLWEVIDASSSKPYGFMPHYPGPGIGGHCIPVDPYYLLSDARNRKIPLQILEKAGKINDLQPHKVVKKIIEIIKKSKTKKRSYKVLLVGLTYKEDVDDLRESASINIWNLLSKKNINVHYHDPYIPQYNGSISQEITSDTVQDIDVIVITTSHGIINYSHLVSFKIPILDTRNILKKFKHPHIHKI